MVHYTAVFTSRAEGPDFTTASSSSRPVYPKICWDKAMPRIFLDAAFIRITSIFRTAGCATAR